MCSLNCHSRRPFPGKSVGIRAASYLIDSVLYSLGHLMLSVLVGVVLGILYVIAGKTFPERVCRRISA